MALIWTCADTGMESGPAGGRVGADCGQQPYSPSTPSNEEEPMDWGDNLGGVQELLAEGGEQLTEGLTTAGIAIVVTPPPPPPLGVQAGEQDGSTHSVAAGEGTSSSKGVPVPVPPPSIRANKASIEGPQSQGADATVRAAAAGTGHDPGDIATRAKDYLRKETEKKVTAIMEALGSDALAYNSIKKQRQQQRPILNLSSGEREQVADTGSMTTILDGRLRLVERNISLGQKQSWTYSFCTRNSECIGCRKHINYQHFPRRGSNSRGERQVIWLTDESMPPVLPVKGDQQCVKIVRLEGGTLQELSEDLARTLSGRQVAAGSAVLLTSLANMAAAGTNGYTEDLVAAIKYLKSHLGDHIIYGPLPNIMLNNCSDGSIIRSSLEVAYWSMHAFKDSPALLQNSFRLLEKMLADRMVGTTLPAPKCVLRLPTLNGGTVTVCSGWDALPQRISMPRISEEEAAMVCMVDEMRDKLAVDLDPAPIVNRWPTVAPTAAGGEAVKTALVVGSSHAGKLAAALRKLGFNTEGIFQANWRATRDNVWELEEKVRNKLDKTRVDVTIFCVLDNSIYYSLLDDGSTKAAFKDREGRFHMEGDIIISSKSAQHALFKNLQPLLEKTGGKPSILCAPMLRYLTVGCCEEPGHMPNRKSRTYEQQLMTDLKETAENFRGFLFTSGNKLIKVLDPAVSWRGKETAEIWTDDPIHPTETAYRLMAEGVISLLRYMESGARKRPRTNSNETGFSGRPPHLNRDQQGGTSNRGGLAQRGRMAPAAAVVTAGGAATAAAGATKPPATLRLHRLIFYALSS
jgi:hypothetical protein